MANEYTSVATTGSLSDTLVTQAYDLLIGEQIRIYPTARLFVEKNGGRPNQSGSSIRKFKYSDFSEAAVTAAKTPLTEEADVDSTKMPPLSSVVVTPNEYGFAVTRTKKLKARTFADIDPEIARAVAFHQVRVLDELVQDTLVTSTNVTYADAGTGDATLTTANGKLTAHLLRVARTKMFADGVEPFYGGFYAAMVHPFVILDLREETGSGGWRVPNEYGTDQSDIWTGEIGEFEGFRFVQNARTRYRKTGSGTGDTQVRVHENFLFGKGGVVEEVIEEPHTVLGPVVDKLQRFRTVGWYGDLGWAIYEPKAVRRIVSTSSENQSLA